MPYLDIEAPISLICLVLLVVSVRVYRWWICYTIAICAFILCLHIYSEGKYVWLAYLWLGVAASQLISGTFCFFPIPENTSEDEGEELDVRIHPKIKPMRRFAFVPIGVAAPVGADRVRCIHCGYPNKMAVSNCEACRENPRF